MANKAYLTPVQSKNLLDYIAGNSESYDHYNHWADREEIPPEKRFTTYGYPMWVHRHRAQLKLAREEHRKATWGGSQFDRNLRLRELEASYERLRGLTSDDVKVTLSIEDAKRKTLELIAKERGETNLKALTPEDDEKNKVTETLAKAFGK
jgi:hypothetical protein